jgi:hypothetical protein
MLHRRDVRREMKQEKVVVEEETQISTLYTNRRRGTSQKEFSFFLLILNL